MYQSFVIPCVLGSYPSGRLRCVHSRNQVMLRESFAKKKEREKVHIRSSVSLSLPDAIFGDRIAPWGVRLANLSQTIIEREENGWSEAGRTLSKRELSVHRHRSEPSGDGNDDEPASRASHALHTSSLTRPTIISGSKVWVLRFPKTSRKVSDT